MDKHYEPVRLLECCRQCPNFGMTWNCPPFDYSPLERLRKYRYITMVMARIAVDDRVEVTMADRILKPVKTILHQSLLEAESDVSESYALLFAGGCDLCDETCSRRDNLPCRHPAMVRPSLEGWGINVTTVANDLFKTPIVWGTGGFLPHQLTLVGAL
ncbi:MAG: DUF2284 domain-containing protein, partial [Muribaculaceae bacterium]|nr:DUF2284 domain-containing protein [Muribaculaceae bacterium]